MIIKYIYNRIFLIGFLFVVLNNICISQELSKLQNSLISDTITLNEISLDSIKFYLNGNSSKIENNLKDTLVINIENKIYRIPYKVTSTAILNLSNQNQYFRLTGLSLHQDSLEYFIRDLFRNPREKLKDSISAINWKNSDIYLKYFEAYDPNSSFRNNNNDKSKSNKDDELQSFLADEKSGYVAQNYENFPLPETIDLQVDLRKIPRVLEILGLEFNFDKLNAGFQKFLLKYGYSAEKKYQNRRTYEEKLD